MVRLKKQTDDDPGAEEVQSDELSRRTILKRVGTSGAGILSVSTVFTGGADADGEPITCSGVTTQCGGGRVVHSGCISHNPSQPRVTIDQGCAGNAYNHGDAYAEYIHEHHPPLAACRSKASLSREIWGHRFDNDDTITLTCDPEIGSTPTQE